MKNFLLFLLFAVVFQTTNAQYTEVINSRRPGFTDSPFSIGTDVLQFESGFFYERINDDTNFLKTSTIGTDVMVRYGKFFEKLEMNLNLKFQYDNINFDDALIEDESRLGLSQLTIGGKYLVYMSKFKDKSKEIRSWKAKNKFDKKRLIPSVAVYAGVNIPVTKNYIRGNFVPGFVKNKLTPKIAIFTQNNFTDKFVFLMNLIMDRVGSNVKENSYILTGTYSVNDRISVFGEHQGIFKGDDIPNDFQFGLGSAYLLSKDRQVDVAIRRISDSHGSAFLVSAGFAWRIDKHNDKFKLLGSDGKVVDDDKKGFFGRLFGKKTKDEKLRKVKTIKAKKRKIKKIDAPKKSKAEKRRQKEELKKLKKEQKKKDKKKDDYNKNYEPPKDDSGK